MVNGVGAAIGDTIRFHRGRCEWSQEQLAEKARMAPTSIVRLENGEIERPRIVTLNKIAEALEIDPRELTSFLLRNPPREPSVEEPIRCTFAAVYQRDGEWWTGYVEELPGANAQERTLQEARESLREAVSDVLEANRELTRTEFEGRDVVREPLSV
jgi:transcriptional regulator with XRE-family HTH domain